MPDEQRRRLVMLRQVVCRSAEILHVAGEAGVRKVARAFPQAGEIEAQHTVSGIGESTSDAPRRADVAGTREAVGEDRPGAGRTARRYLDAAGEGFAGRVGKLYVHVGASRRIRFNYRGPAARTLVPARRPAGTGKNVSNRRIGSMCRRELGISVAFPDPRPGTGLRAIRARPGMAWS